MKNVAGTDAVESVSEPEAEIIQRYDRLVKYLARRFRQNTDDLVQVGRIELLEAHRMWQDLPHYAAFWTYARKFVLGGMVEFATREISRIAKEEEAGMGLAPSPECPPDVMLEVREHMAALAPREASVLQLFVEGHNAEEIAESQNISRSRVYQVIEEASRSIRRRA
jgi:RNA polymerase sigma factor (sigma-70 family)